MEIYRAHDILVAIVNKELPTRMDPLSERGLRAALDALCWVLEHDTKHGCNTAFGDNLRKIEEDLAAHGFHLHRKNN